ncbi:terpenoid cyclases/Protein prenyltransferase [Polyporus arcularius HHB13444]|uniref:Terpenoid cyclases/Protein prenyltransferase n=1 Tax=Polyporus arcularius HHB13444 TaxID=1314778 RepID=A0A5C3PUS5_9APHY|nr:terpenoid cyclases/Protein prenyltransferase [Polyporus arcularius HHB13444]
MSLSRKGHASHSRRCLIGLPFSQVDIDSSRIALAFYCLGTLDILNSIEDQSSELDRETWREWLWEQHISGVYGTGFRPSPYVTPEDYKGEPSEYDLPHLVMTYTALLCLAILRDDFSQLDRPGILRFLGACQREDGSFSALPNGGESDLRMLYCAFAISDFLDDWSGIDVDAAIAYIQRCYSYEGGYGQTPSGEALGGTSYCAIASLQLAPDTPSSPRAGRLSGAQRLRTIRWLVQNQTAEGGFCGRTCKLADACYCFWCGAALSILGAGDLVDKRALADFLEKCQFKYGGLSKAPGERPDPYHTYLSLAILAILPSDHGDDESWKLPRLNALWNATEETAAWAREHIPAKARAS